MLRPVEQLVELVLMPGGVVIYRHRSHQIDVFPHGLAGATAFKVFGGRSECAEVRVLNDFVDGGDGFLRGLRLGQVEAGDLEAVEQETGSAGIEVIGGYALKDFADGALDGAAVFRDGQVKLAATLLSADRIGDGFAGLVVVVAEVFVAECWAGATVPVGEDVAALETDGGAGICGRHWDPSPGVFVCKVFKNLGLGPYP